MKTIYIVCMIALLGATMATPAMAQTLTCPYDICVNETGWWRDGGGFHAVVLSIGNNMGTGGVDNANEGETVFVYNGTYTLVSSILIRKPNITLKGEGAEVVTIDGGRWHRGIKIGTTGPSASGCVIEGLKVRNTKLALWVDPPDCIIRDCIFEELYPLDMGNIFLDADNTTFENNVVLNANSTHYAIETYHSNCIFRNNTIANSAGEYGAILIGGDIDLGTGGADNVFVQNNFVSNNNDGVALDYAGEGNKIYLNNFIDNGASVTHSTAYWNSPGLIEYDYKGSTYTNYLGNYWSDSTGGDADRDGIRDKTYAIRKPDNVDYYPLMEPFENYYQYPTTKPDLIPTSLSPTTLHLDQLNTLTAMIRNDGEGNASSFNVSLKLGEELIGTKTMDALNINEEKSVDFTWTPTSAGTFNLTVTVDPENVINEFDETNNVMEKTVTIPQPDLIPTSLQPTTLHLDQPGTLTATILNDGGGNASSFNVSLKLGEALIGTKTVDALNIGEEKSVDFTWTPTSAGTFNLTVTADTENVIDEFDETNNVMTVMVTVERASTPFLISGEVNYENGDAASNLTVTVTNLGTSEEFVVKTDASSNYYRTLTDSMRVSVGDTIKINVTDGTNYNETSHTVTADELNGGGFGEDLTLTTTPDLSITKISLKTPGYANEENVLGVGVKNIGRADAGLFSVSLSVDGTPMGELTVSSLAVGETAELEYIWTPAIAGEHILSATADVNSEVEESSEANNDLARTSVIIKRTDWPQFHYDEVHLGFSSSKAPDTNETLWISDDISAIGGTSSAVADGKVFAYGGPTGWSGGDGALYCFDETTGAILWNVGIPAPAWGSWSSPAYHDGKVFTSTDREAGCYNATTGEQIWVFENPTNEPSVNGGPVVADGKVIVNDWQAGHYYCLDEETGELLWTFTEEQTGSWGTGYTQGVPAYEDGKFYLTTWVYIGGNVYCVDADTGTEIWHTTTPLDTCGSPTVVDGTVYVTTYDFYGDGDIYAMNATNGSILWQKTIQRTDSTPAVAYGNVYVTGGSKGYSDRQTYCFNATTGNLTWSTDTADEIGAWTCSVAVADGKVFVGTEGGWFDYAGTYALDAFTGDVIWNYPEGGSSPAVAEGTVFTIGGGRVYAFGGSEIPAGVRIEPEILNLNATSGVFTAFITLPVGCDVADIDVSTVECEGASALNGTIAAHDNGTLVVKFDREDLREDLPAGEVEMTVTGEMTDGRRFEGSDTVRVIAKGKGA